VARVLITGGAGFIGCHLVRKLLARGYDVRVLDRLIEQVHGAGAKRPAGLLHDAELIVGDVRDSDTLGKALKRVDKVVHLAAEVGVGQSMYAIDRYVSVNDLGTAALFQELIEQPVERVVVASSMSIYGEGLYRNAAGEVVETAERQQRSASGSWDPVDDQGVPLLPVPTPEWKRPSLASVYALTKYVQERLTLTTTAAYGMQGVALRLFNVYGAGQALSNPYTGVLAIFASRLLNGRPPVVFEDGRQRRDFVHVQDVAEAFVLALEHPKANQQVFNIASGQSRDVASVAHALAAAMGRPDLRAETTGKGRAGDIRHCFADVTAARDILDFRAERDFSDSLSALVEWVADQEAVDRLPHARLELEARGLVA
jgi:dTDP-L-rhamnose 4-epimerase